MKKITVFLLLILFAANLFSQNPVSLSGKVTDKQTGAALPGATVAIKGGKFAVITNNEGYYSFQKINAGAVILIVSHIGYETSELNVNGSTVNATLYPDTRVGSEVVITASKRPEKITNAPASIQVIGVKDIEQFAGSNVSELLSKVQGVEYTRSGVTEINLNARGLNSAFNNKVFQIVDGRNSMSSLSASLPVMNRSSSIKDDIERLEIVLGPQSALYGPNAHNAIFNTITKDPRKYAGTTVAISAGSRNQFSGRLRYATKINKKWAYKLSGEYATGKEFSFNDSVYAGNQNGTTPFFGSAVAIPGHNVDFDFRHIRGEGHVYYSVTPKADIILSSGSSDNNWTQVTTGGRNQMRGISHSFVQARFVHPRFFANIYNTWGSLGTSYGIATYTRDFWNRTNSTSSSGPNRRLSPDSAELFALRLGNMFKEESERINAEVQYNYTFQKAGLFLVAGLNYQNEKPNGFGITLIDSFRQISVRQYGVVLQLEKSLPWGMRLISATRFDNHDNFGNFFSPKFAVTKPIGDGTFRITWGKAYAMPSIQNQYAGINRSLFGNGGEGIKYIRTDAKYSDPASISYTTPIKPEQISTWEFGYKGTIAKKLFIDINYYHGISENFISPTRSVRGRVLSVNGIDVTHSQPTAGAVVNDTLRNASFTTFFNYGDVRAYGLDLGLTYTFNKFFSLAVKYSWFGSDITKDNVKNDANKDGFVSLEEKSLNAPQNRGVVILNIQNLAKERLFIMLSARFVEQYDFYSGAQIGTAAGYGKRGAIERPGQAPIIKNYDWGPLGGFTTIDLSAGYKLNQMVSVNLGVTNLFNTRQIEFVGSPSIGRLIMAEVKVNVPDGKQQK
ncbi:MAG: TonB-dependent receptor [Lacibacter sp.]|nr:TonB-dependent receptor [Lacibacter sp.]